MNCRRLCDSEFGYRRTSDFLLGSEHSKCASAGCEPEGGGSGDSESKKRRISG